MRTFKCRLLLALLSTSSALACDQSSAPPDAWRATVLGTVIDHSGQRVAAGVTMRLVRLWPDSGSTQLGNCIGKLTLPQMQTTDATGNYFFEVIGEGQPLLACVVVQATGLTPNFGNAYVERDSVLIGPTGTTQIRIQLQLDR